MPRGRRRRDGGDVAASSAPIVLAPSMPSYYFNLNTLKFWLSLDIYCEMDV
jgi:hypothetical protein